MAKIRIQSIRIKLIQEISGNMYSMCILHDVRSSTMWMRELCHYRLLLHIMIYKTDILTLSVAHILYINEIYINAARMTEMLGSVRNLKLCTHLFAVIICGCSPCHLDEREIGALE